MEIDFKKIEKKWQDKWEKAKIFQVKEGKKKKYYVLDMFPYPSAAGLHIGHAFVYTLGDIFARFKRLQGFNVLYPIGYDSLGLPAENAAIKAGTHPRTYTENSMKNFMKQQKAMGWSYDWSRMIKSHDSEFYKWDQWIFLKMFEKGMAYRKKAPVNWCSKCQTVLANEQVINGKCWRHEDNSVEIKHLEQWFFRITDYAEELLTGLEKINWPENAKKLQRNWIGKSFGTEINFEIETPEKKKPTIIIAHGWCGNSKGNWFQWFKEEYKDKFDIIIPDFPNTNKPKLKEWINELEKYKDKINENTILIGHSLGCSTICKFLGKNKIKVGKIILVAPSPASFNKGDFDIIKKLKAPKEAENSLKEYLEDLNINFNDVKKYAEKFVLYISKDDQYIDDYDYRLREYSDLKAELKIFENKGHFNEETGITKFPEIESDLSEKWPIFTTRPDTIYGVTFMVISAQHTKLFDIVTDKQKKEVEAFLKKLKSVSEKELEEMEKDGVFTGSYAINPLTNEKVPVYAGNFVVADYGSGMVMAVPAHDERDFQFAKKYKIPIKIVIQNKENNLNEKTMQQAYTNNGILVNSKEFNGLENEKAKEEITKLLEKKKLGKKTINYKLRDWLVSRQRYWGTPIPIIYCDKCGIVPVPEKQLPVLLPEKVKFGKGNPLATNKKFLEVKCPKCKGKARRETDTMDTFVNSSWYYLRYCDPKNNKEIFDKKKVDYWCPIDQYIGGPEHITMHLIYARFYTKFLRDLGLLKFDEPALRYFTQGIVHSPDGEKMSKSRGNVIEPLAIIEKYGADTLRMALLSFASADKDSTWDEKIIIGSHKFLNRVYNHITQVKTGKSNERVESKINKTIKEVSEDVENFKHNLALIKLRVLFDFLEDNEISKKDLESFLKMLHIYCPHITEELWAKIGNKSFISLAEWPVADEKKIDLKLEKQEQQVSQLAGDINNIIKIVEGKGEKITKGYVYVIPNEKSVYENGKELIEKKTNINIEVFAVNDKNKYDPENKAGRTKPGKPAIYLEQK